LRKTGDHENVMRAFQCFCTTDAFYIEVEHFPLTLEHVIACQAFPTEQELAVISTQVLDGLLYFTTQRFKHRSLDCSSVLINLDGRIQIARLEHCRPLLPGEKQKEDVTSVARITMKLMQKYIKADGVLSRQS